MIHKAGKDGDAGGTGTASLRAFVDRREDALFGDWRRHPDIDLADGVWLVRRPARSLSHSTQPQHAARSHGHSIQRAVTATRTQHSSMQP